MTVFNSNPYLPSAGDQILARVEDAPEMVAVYNPTHRTVRAVDLDAGEVLHFYVQVADLAAAQKLAAQLTAVSPLSVRL